MIKYVIAHCVPVHKQLKFLQFTSFSIKFVGLVISFFMKQYCIAIGYTYVHIGRATPLYPDQPSFNGIYSLF